MHDSSGECICESERVRGGVSIIERARGAVLTFDLSSENLLVPATTTTTAATASSSSPHHISEKSTGGALALVTPGGAEAGIATVAEQVTPSTDSTSHDTRSKTYTATEEMTRNRNPSLGEQRREKATDSRKNTSHAVRLTSTAGDASNADSLQQLTCPLSSVVHRRGRGSHQSRPDHFNTPESASRMVIDWLHRATDASSGATTARTSIAVHKP